ncbi:MAG: hypothetical protein ACE5KW_05750 [Dehalococcoidia bacterium]
MVSVTAEVDIAQSRLPSRAAAATSSKGASDSSDGFALILKNK